MISWRLKTLRIRDIQNNPKNPRQIKNSHLAHLENLVHKFGMIDKPIVNADMMLIGGHQRVKILKKMKVKEVECWMPDQLLEPADVDQLCIGLNLNQGEWDWDILANRWEPLDLLKFGFTEDQLLGHAEKAEEVLDSDPEVSNSKKEKCCPNCGFEF